MVEVSKLDLLIWYEITYLDVSWMFHLIQCFQASLYKSTDFNTDIKYLFYLTHLPSLLVC